MMYGKKSAQVWNILRGGSILRSWNPEQSALETYFPPIYQIIPLLGKPLFTGGNIKTHIAWG